ncbi:MAG: diguanylate cyclase [Vicinamibacterales bacterium]
MAPHGAAPAVRWHRRLEARVAIALGLLVVGTVTAVLVLVIRLVSSESRHRAEAGLEGARTAFYSLLDSRAASASALARLVTELPVFRAHLTDARLAADRATISQMADTYRRQLGAAFVVVTDGRGRWLASPGWQASGATPPSLAGTIDSSLAGDAGQAVIERGGALFLVVALPARFADEVLGALAVGFILDDALAQELARLAQCEVLLVSSGRVAATSLRARAHSDTVRLAEAAAHLETGVLSDLQQIGDYRYVGGAFPIRAASPPGDSGRLVLLSDWQPTQQFVDQLRERFLVGGLAVLALALAGGLVLSRRVSRPLRELAGAAADVAGGNLTMQLAIRGSAEEVTVARAFNDMSASLRTAHDRLMHDAIHDPLTQLPNRVLFMERLERAMARRVRHPGSLVAVLFIDLDRFKHVNDSLGHAVGDELLVEFARRLGTVVRRDDLVSRMPASDGSPESNTLARFGGDEFVVLLDDIREPVDAVRVAERVHQMTRQALQVGAHEIFATPSIGVTVCSPDHRSGSDVMRDADLAMHRAKAAGGNGYAVFDARMHDAAVERLRLETELRRALERGELSLSYQPIVSLASRAVSGYEALVRWQHPSGGCSSQAPSSAWPRRSASSRRSTTGRWPRRAGRARPGTRPIPRRR